MHGRGTPQAFGRINSWNGGSWQESYLGNSSITQTFASNSWMGK